MVGELGATVEAFVNWMRRKDDSGKVTYKTYRALTALADRWDIPMLSYDIDVLSMTLKH
jgi:hypothetical protein